MSGKVVFTKDRAALVKKILVIGDIHIGYEYELYQSGISLPSQTGKILERIRKLLKETKAKRILFLGDVKHNIPFPSFQEKNELMEFLSVLIEEVGEIIIVKGNHDGDIEKYIPSEIKVFGGEGVRIKSFAFAHGHAWIGKELLKAKYLFLAHEHPAVEFRDKLGYRAVEPCWVMSKPLNNAFEDRFKEKSNIEKAIIVPAFNHLIGGMSFNIPDFSPLGPNTTLLDLKSAEIYLVDGTHLGKLKNLI